MQRTYKSASWLTISLLAAGLALGSSAHAAKPWIAVPSAMSGEVLVVSGGSLKAGESVKVRVTDPAGQRYNQMDVASADGSLAVQITPGAEGRHKVDVYNAKGKRIGGGDFIYSN